MGVVDDHVVRGNRQVNSELVAGQASLGLGGQRCQSHTSNTDAPSVRLKQMCDQSAEKDSRL